MVVKAVNDTMLVSVKRTLMVAVLVVIDVEWSVMGDGDDDGEGFD